MKIVVNVSAKESYTFELGELRNCTKVRRYYYTDHAANVRDLLSKLTREDEPLFLPEEIESLLEHSIFDETATPSGTPLVIDKPYTVITFYRY